MERVKTRSRTVQGTDVVTSLDEEAHAPVSTFQLDVGQRLSINMNKISESIKAIRERLTSLERKQSLHEVNLEQLNAKIEKLECLTSHTEQLTNLSAISEELQSITQLTQDVNNIREGLTALDNVVYKDE